MLALYIVLGVIVNGGCMVGLRWEWQEIRTKQKSEAGEVEVGELLERPDLEHIASDRDQSAEAGYVTVWQTLDGLAARMTLLAVASDELAHRCRTRALEGGVPLRPLEEVDYYVQLPADVGDNAPRPGAPDGWQALDRALNHLAAIYESDDAAVHADAHEQISIAARRLGDELAVDGVQTDLDHCIFCQREAGEDLRVLYTPRAAICEDCVHRVSTAPSTSSRNERQARRGRRRDRCPRSMGALAGALGSGQRPTHPAPARNPRGHSVANRR